MYCTKKKKISLFQGKLLYNDISCKVHGRSISFHKQNSANPREHSQIVSLFDIMITPFSTFRVHYRVLYK